MRGEAQKTTKEGGTHSFDVSIRLDAFFFLNIQGISGGYIYTCIHILPGGGLK